MEGTNGIEGPRQGPHESGRDKRFEDTIKKTSGRGGSPDAGFVKDLISKENYDKWLQIQENPQGYEGNDIDKVSENVNRAREFAGFWQQFGNTYYSESEREVLAAMFVPDKFVEYSNKKAEMIAARMGISIDALKDDANSSICVEISEEVRKDMVLNYGNLLRRIDETKSSEFFEEIVRQDMYKGIDVAILNLNKGVSQLGRYFETNKVEGFKFNFFKRTSKALDEEKAMRNGQMNAFQRIQPESMAEKIDSDEFLKKIELFGDHEYNLRKYLHNVRALSLAGPGKDPHFARMQGFAEQLTTVDLDELTMLPDYDVVSTALQLHSKMVQEELVRNDWKHTPTMFLREKGELYTKIERDTMKQLEIIFKGKFRLDDGVSSEKRDNWRLRRAFDMAMGLTRGVFMNELEYAAYADPSVNNDGTPSFTSYYTSDPNALCAFDPKHLMLRFQSEGMIMGPMLFTPIEGEKKGPWDHATMMKRMDEYFKAFVEGKKAFSKEFKDEKLFIDLLQNIGDIGGLPRRNGWRWEMGARGLYEDNSPEDGKHHLENIKQVENIGFEIFSYYLNNLVKPDFLEGKDSTTKQPDASVFAKRDEFFSYLFDSYIKPNTTQGQDYAGFLGTIRGNFKTEKDMYDFMLKKAQVGCIYNRFPSFLVKNERNRFTNDGKRSWYLLKEDALMKSMGDEGFDKAMKNLGLAETMLRLEVSQEMEKSMLKNGKLHNGGIKYELNEVKIRGLLEDKLNSQQELDNVVKLYGKIKEKYLTDEKFEDYKKKYIGGDREYRYTVGVEELDSRFLSFRASGGRIIPRAVGDIAKIETDVAGSLGHLLGSLHKVAIDPKHDFSPLIEHISKIKSTIEGIHGQERAEEIAYRFIKLAITYYRKDDIARPWLGLPGVSRKNSIAAEFLGKTHDVWEWDSIDIDKFLVTIENNRILRKEPYAYGGMNINKVMEKIPLKIFGMKTPFNINRLKPSHKENYSQKMRKDVDATYKDIFADILNKYGLAALMFLLYSWGAKAFQENFSPQRER